MNDERGLELFQQMSVAAFSEKHWAQMADEHRAKCEQLSRRKQTEAIKEELAACDRMIGMALRTSRNERRRFDKLWDEWQKMQPPPQPISDISNRRERMDLIADVTDALSIVSDAVSRGDDWWVDVMEGLERQLTALKAGLNALERAKAANLTKRYSNNADRMALCRRTIIMLFGSAQARAKYQENLREEIRTMLSVRR
ncbi:hypothetical protein ABIF78_007770 [Bradyrhizobium japonicum]